MVTAIPGSTAVIFAAFLVKSLPLEILKWVVICVIIYTSTVMLAAAFKPKNQ